MRGLTVALLALAVVAGAYLRFNGLDEREMSADEGASWAAAAAPTFTEVLQRQAHLNPGKFGLHDLALHAWMGTFGDSLASIRALSAGAGTVAIVLVFFLSDEIFWRDLAGKDLADSRVATTPASEPNEIFGESEIVHSVSAVAALLFAVNLVSIKYSREARMYPLALALMLAQGCVFLRAARSGGFINYAGAAIFTALCIAATLTASLILLPEGLWLPYTIVVEGIEKFGRVMRLTIALSIGLTLLAPLGLNYCRAGGGVPPADVTKWISRPEAWAPLSLFNKATGTFAFPVMAAMAVWGVIKWWRDFAGGVRFALLWMFAAPLLLVIVSYAVRPAFVERYLLSCFVPFFILVALGAWSFASCWARIGMVVLLAALALGHVLEFNRRLHDAQWREATAASVAQLGNEGSIAVAPRYAVNVVRYYLAHGSASRVSAVGFDNPAAVLIVADTGVAPREASQLARAYPHVLARVRGLVVRGHQQANER
jgi:hypothetical protein